MIYILIIIILLSIINIVISCYNKRYKVGKKVYFYNGDELIVGVVRNEKLIEVVDGFGEVYLIKQKQIIKGKKICIK